MSKKFSEIISGQVLKTEAILKYVTKKPMADPIIYMHLTMALNSLKVVQLAAARMDDRKCVCAIDEEAAFSQMKAFFKGVESVYERHYKNEG